MDLGAPELLIILVIALLIFGSNRLPKLARSLGQASREFRAGTQEGLQHDLTGSHMPPPAPSGVSSSEPSRN